MTAVVEACRAQIAAALLRFFLGRLDDALRPRPPPRRGARRPRRCPRGRPVMMAMRLISSEKPCTQQEREGQRDQELGRIDRQAAGVGRLLVLQQREPEERPAQVERARTSRGSGRTCARTRRSSRARAWGSVLFTMSMRMCSLDSSVHAEHSRKTAPNRIHWISSHELDEVLKTLRTMALAALTSTAARMAQATIWPTRVLNASTARLKLSSPFNRSSHRFFLFFWAGTDDSARPGCLVYSGCYRDIQRPRLPLSANSVSKPGHFRQ